jgi:hypothetical protein
MSRCNLLVRALLMVMVIGAMRLTADDAKFSEKYADKLKTERFREDGETFVEYWVYPTGSFSFSGTFFVENTPLPADFDEDTPIAISVGNYFAEGTLGGEMGDPKYVAGKSSATLTDKREGWDANDKMKMVTVGKVSIKFTKKGIKVTVAMKTGMDPKYFVDFADSPLAGDMAGEIGEFGPVELPIMVQLGDNVFEGTLQVDGKGACKTVTKKVFDETEEFELCSVAAKSQKGSLAEAEE